VSSENNKYLKEMKKNIAIFASGNGTNFETIARAVKKNKINANLAFLLCDKPDAFVLKRAKKLKVRVILINRDDFYSKEDFERAIIYNLKEDKIGLIVLAGFMRLLTSKFVKKYKNRIINIHPSLLPDFKGAHAIRDAFRARAKVTGVTVHFVEEEVDSGPVILQERLPIKNTDTLITLESRIHRLEHKIYPQAVKLFLDGKLKCSGRKVIRV
jgi:phosphoribosylglycinamide formyltransferase 1